MLDIKWEDFLKANGISTVKASQRSGISLRSAYNIKSSNKVSFKQLERLQTAFPNIKKFVKHDTIKIKWGCKAIEGI